MTLVGPLAARPDVRAAVRQRLGGHPARGASDCPSDARPVSLPFDSSCKIATMTFVPPSPPERALSLGLPLSTSARRGLTAGVACSSGSSDQAKTPTPATIDATPTARRPPRRRQPPPRRRRPPSPRRRSRQRVVSPLQAEPTQAAARRRRPPPRRRRPLRRPCRCTRTMLVVPPEIGQGQTTTVEVAGQGAASAIAFCDNVRYPLVSHGQRLLGRHRDRRRCERSASTPSRSQLFDSDGNVISSWRRK